MNCRFSVNRLDAVCTPENLFRSKRRNGRTTELHVRTAVTSCVARGASRLLSTDFNLSEVERKRGFQLPTHIQEAVEQYQHPARNGLRFVRSYGVGGAWNPAKL